MLASLHARLMAVPPIPVGDHVKRGGLNLDTLWTTGIAMAVVLGLGFYVRARATSSKPSRIQLAWEFVVGAVSDQVENSLGPKYRRAVPLAVTIFVFVLAADWIEIFPGLFRNTDYLPSPTADVNLTYALGVLVFIVTNFEAMRARGVGGFFKHLVKRPGVPAAMAPLNIIEELVQPITLALRLFGNLFAGGIMIALLLALPIYFAPVTVALTVVWKLFDMFIGAMQAFIFALLTLLYYQFATETGDH